MMRTIDAVWVKLIAKTLQRRGIAATELLQKAEIKPYLLNQKAARIPFYQHAALLDLAAKATENGCFGLDLVANEIDPRDSGLLGYTALSSKTFGEALKVVERYLHVLNEAIDVSVEFSPREVTIDYHLSDARLAAPRQAVEFAAANLVRGARVLTNSRLRPGEVKFRHSRNNDIAKFERFFGCPVHFGTRHNSLTFSRRQLTLPVATADERLHQLLTGYCEEIIASREDSSPDLQHRVERIIAKLLSRGEAETEAVAHELGMSVRTLARRLADLGVSFAQILDELRYDLALKYLQDPNLSLSQIAFLLGYSELSAFSHAFRRWARATPGEWRTKHPRSIGTPFMVRS
jgi:AraC-like DNA-binding protein